MHSLDKHFRSQLEKAINPARETAEAGARAALEQLGVADAKPAAHLSDEDRALRRRLRAHGRQLGDSLNGGKTQTVERLVAETAYEHWHRMLFAHFLAENDLLIYEGIAISLDECQELAEEGEADSGWELAGRLAATMLPQIFRPDSPVFELELPPEHQQKLEQLVADLPDDVFTASDSLGWVYQFWQTKKKAEVNASEVKIGARELPAVTQLFTEPYMVSFLLDNSLGAWWAARRLSEADLKNAESDDELRHKAAIPGVPLEYLRFVQQDDGSWTPASGTFDAWPEDLAELKTLDPCCGSGHFLVAAFLMLVPMRMQREGLPARDAVDAVLRDNLHGLELDQRCVELAAFALALTAWTYPDAGGYRPLPELQLACTGLSVSVAKEEWKQLAAQNGKQGRQNLAIALDWLHDTFKHAPTLGSLINPAKTDAAKIVDWDDLSATLEQALSLSAPASSGTDDQQRETAVVAQGLAKAATLLAGQYQWVITNVPYLARGKQSDKLRDFCQRHYPAAKNDLATVFLEHCLEFCKRGGTSSVVVPQNWLFLTTYKKFREKLLKRDTWHLIARLGEGGFDSSAAAGAFVAMLSLSRGNAAQYAGGLFDNVNEANLIRGLDVSEPRTAPEKAAQLLADDVKSVEQAKQRKNPDARISFEHSSNLPLLAEIADYGKGSTTGDGPRFLLHVWEIPQVIESHVFWLNSPNGRDPLSGRTQLCNVPLDNVELNLQHGCRLHGQSVFGKKGVVVNKMRRLEPFLYRGEVFDDNICPICPADEHAILAVWAYVESNKFHDNVRALDQKLNVTAATITKVPFDLEYWTQVAEQKYPNGLPQPYTNDPTQWIFHGHPSGSVIWAEDAKWTAHGQLRTDDTVLQVAVARLLGYRWPAERDADMELADAQREWVNRCDELLAYADDDGIVCLPPVRGERSAADRLLDLLAAAYGDAWNNEVLAELLKSADHAGKSLETWLTDKFFAQHCKLFHNRPFIWPIWDGLKDGFAALVNYHKLDHKNLETLTYTYLGDWITRQKQDKAGGVDGAEERLAAAQSLKKKLELILEGEAPYDIFVRWKPLAEQPIGWNPDLNDGVRLNIRPFMTMPDVKKKGAGILAHTPNIHWNKDRGKDVESAPWYHLGPEYGGKKGDRINEHHLSLREKQAAKESADREFYESS